jgi:eukaryotic-like serine/threonine-protein kinase
VTALEPVPARRLQPGVPRDLDTVCLKCLQKDPAKRYTSAAALADDLRRFLRGEPVKACPTPAWERALKWGRRRPAAAALLAVSAAALLTVALLAAGYSARLKVARDRAQQSEARAAQQKEEAEANYQLARRLVDDLSAKLSDEDNASLEELRQYFLHASLAYYERFTQARGDEPALRAARGLALLRLARITAELGAKESRALPLYHEALKVFEGLLRDHPEDGYRNDLAQVCYWLGRAYADLGQPEKAEEYLNEARAIQGRLLEGAPQEAAYRRALAATWFALGQVCFARGCGRDHVEAAYRKALGLLGEVGRAGGLTAADEDMIGDVHQSLGNFYRTHKEYDKARASYLKALAVEEKLVRAHPGVANYGNDLGSTYFGLATIDYLEGRTESGWGYLQKSRTIRERLVEEHPTVTQFAVDLGRTYRQLGNQSTPVAQRIDWYTRAIRVLDGVLKKEPREREARRLLDWSYTGRARVLTGLGRYAEALDDWGRVGAAFRAQVRQAAVGYAQTLAGVGRTGEALDEVAKLDNTHLQSTAAIDLARVYSLCARSARHDAALGMVTGEALGEVCARRALALLEQAAAAGAFKGGGRRGVLKNDPMFAPLRGRKDFQKLLGAGATLAERRRAAEGQPAVFPLPGCESGGGLGLTAHVARAAPRLPARARFSQRRKGP